MTDLDFQEDVTVSLINSMGGDQSIVQAARVSVVGLNEVDPDDELSGLINYLMKHHHGSPFEHTALQFYVKAPIFVFREFHRHRVGFSYNEVSGRYKELSAEFYVPSADRPLVNIGTSARPEMTPAEPEVVDSTRAIIEASYERAWDDYQALLASGIAKEVARVVLPVGIMSQMYVTCNARSLMHFLSLRTHDKGAAFVSRPQLEIEMVARKMEDAFAQLFPIAHKTFVDNGRVSP